MSIIDNLNKIGSLKVIDDKFDKSLKIFLVLVTLCGTALAVFGQINKVCAAAEQVPVIEKRVTVLEASIVAELKNIDGRLKRIERKLDGRN